MIDKLNKDTQEIKTKHRQIQTDMQADSITKMKTNSKNRFID